MEIKLFLGFYALHNVYSFCTVLDTFASQFKVSTFPHPGVCTIQIIISYELSTYVV